MFILQLFVRETCKEMLDIQVPISLQPRDKIQDIVDLCIEKFSNCQPEVARKRVGTFLKNCRKTEKRKIQGDPRPSRGSKVRYREDKQGFFTFNQTKTKGRVINENKTKNLIFPEEKETQEGIATESSQSMGSWIFDRVSSLQVSNL